MALAYNDFFPAALAFLHLARAAAASLALVAGLLRRSFFLAGMGADGTDPLIRAQRALAPAAIAARPARDMRRFFFGSFAPTTGAGISPLPRAMESIWPCKSSIFSLIAMIR